MDLTPGTVLDNYKLLARVGAGSCGTVWQTENIVSGELEALKILSNSDLAERELRALKLYREINHPALIRVRHIGRAGDTLFYTMDWCESSLAERKVNAKELLEIAQTLAEGLAALHSRGLLHRDIKPANIFFRQGSPVLGDIGLLTRMEGATFAGSPGFLSPAILNGKVTADCYSDCYALAKSIYCALSGLRPEQFPLYTGEMTPEASLLMRAVMAVCNESHTIRNAGEFLDFLKNPPQIKRTFPVWPWICCLIVLIAGGITGGLLIWQKDSKNVPAKKTEVPPLQNPVQETKPVLSTPGKVAIPEQAVPAKQEKAAKPAASVDSVAQLEKRNEELDKDPVRAEILQKMMEPSAGVKAKLHELQQDREAYRIIGNFGTGKLPEIQKYEEEFILEMLSSDQQKTFLKCKGEIQKIQSGEKWVKMAKRWMNAEYPSQLRKLNLEKNLDGMSALRQIAKQNPDLVVLMKQAECHIIWNSVVDRALRLHMHAVETKTSDLARKPDAELSSMLDSLAAATAEYSKVFYQQ